MAANASPQDAAAYLGPSAQCFAILAAAEFSGGIVRGISGFGSAIVLVLFWVFFSSVGLDAGEPAGCAQVNGPDVAHRPTAYRQHGGEGLLLSS